MGSTTQGVFELSGVQVLRASHAKEVPDVLQAAAAQAYENLVLKKWWTRWTGAANADGLAVVRAFYGKYRVTVNGKESIIDLPRASGSKALDIE